MNMNKEKLFFRVLQKAVNNGYRSEDIEQCECATCIVFSRDFLKAFWGEKWAKCTSGHDCFYAKNSICRCGSDIIPSWCYHGHKMLDEVFAGRNPLQYLAQYL
jgi:hypothetical protein